MDVKRYAKAQPDRTAAIVCVTIGALALLIGYLGVSGTALTYEQLPYIVSGGLLGIALIGVGSTLWLSADLTDEWRKLDRVEDALQQAVDRGVLPVSVQQDQDVSPAPVEESAAPAPQRRSASRS